MSHGPSILAIYGVTVLLSVKMSSQLATSEETISFPNHPRRTAEWLVGVMLLVGHLTSQQHIAATLRQKMRINCAISASYGKLSPG